MKPNQITSPSISNAISSLVVVGGVGGYNYNATSTTRRSSLSPRLLLLSAAAANNNNNHHHRHHRRTPSPPITTTTTPHSAASSSSSSVTTPDDDDDDNYLCPASNNNNEEEEYKLCRRVVRMVAVVGEGSISPLNSTPWFHIFLHTAERLKWVDKTYELLVFTDKLLGSDAPHVENLTTELMRANILVVLSVTKEESANFLLNNSQNIPNIICFDSSPLVKNKLGGLIVQTEVRGNIFNKLAELSRPKKIKESTQMLRTISEAWDRQNSDIRFCLLIIINAYIRPVPILNNLRAKGFSTLKCMVQNCGPQILNCLLDPDCRKALQCLNQCSPLDQVCNYQCIASYESKYLEEFSLCVLQKNNCLELDSNIPKVPFVPPMVKFRGEDISHETAEDLFIGWLGNLEWSWRVVAGQNPAYDQFPCQYQLFYRGRAKGSFWYEPVFQVRTFEGELVWRRRKYRVKRGKVPGTFNFSVLDNGVVSNEHWTIVHVCNDLSWGLFHYHGAARVAGQSYTGAVLVSPDGAYPDATNKSRLVSALDRCRIKEWELFNVDNCSCVDPPLGLPEGSSLHCKLEIEK